MTLHICKFKIASIVWTFLPCQVGCLERFGWWCRPYLNVSARSHAVHLIIVSIQMIFLISQCFRFLNGPVGLMLCDNPKRYQQLFWINVFFIFLYETCCQGLGIWIRFARNARSSIAKCWCSAPVLENFVTCFKPMVWIVNNCAWVVKFHIIVYIHNSFAN